MDHSNHINFIVDSIKAHDFDGSVADYIPELKKADPGHFGMALFPLDGEPCMAGDGALPFTIQSISKPLVLIQALLDCGEDAVFSRVGMEPTGDPFNSLVRLETCSSLKKPFNPMINAGAIAISGLIKGLDNGERLQRILELACTLTGNDGIGINREVFSSEQETGFRNRSMAWFMKDLGIIDGSVDEVLELYFMHCSIEMNTLDLARIGAVLANGGTCPVTGKQVFSRRISRIVTSVMFTCGMYDASGRFAMQVGIPSKSGVGGGILSVVPGRMGIGTFGPALDLQGNSVRGVAGLSMLSERLDLHVL